jgi:hypothetical protein
MPVKVWDATNAGLPYPQAIILSKVTYFHLKAKASFNGQRFWAVTRQDLSDLTNLTLEQVRHSLERLVQYGLIQVEQHQFKGASMSFIRPLIDDITTWKKPKAGPKNRIKKGKRPHPAIGKFPHPEREISLSYRMGQFPYPYKPTENSLSSPENIARSAAREPPHQKSLQSCSGAECDLTVYPDKDDEPMKVSDTVAKFAERSEEARQRIANPDSLRGEHTIESIKKVWKQALASLKIFPKTFTHADTACLNRILANAPDGEAAALLATLVNEWGSFVNLLETEHGGYKVSRTPRIDIISKNIGVAIGWYISRLEDKLAEKAVQASKPPAGAYPPLTLVKPAQQAPVEDFGVIIPEGGKPSWNGDELVFHRNGSPVSTPEQKYARMVVVNGVVKALAWWISSGNNAKGPVPQHPERYFRGALKEEVLQLIAEYDQATGVK